MAWSSTIMVLVGQVERDKLRLVRGKMTKTTLGQKSHNQPGKDV